MPAKSKSSTTTGPKKKQRKTVRLPVEEIHGKRKRGQTTFYQITRTGSYHLEWVKSTKVPKAAIRDFEEQEREDEREKRSAEERKRREERCKKREETISLATAIAAVAAMAAASGADEEPMIEDAIIPAVQDPLGPISLPAPPAACDLSSVATLSLSSSTSSVARTESSAAATLPLMNADTDDETRSPTPADEPPVDVSGASPATPIVAEDGVEIQNPRPERLPSRPPTPEARPLPFPHLHLLTRSMDITITPATTTVNSDTSTNVVSAQTGSCIPSLWTPAPNPSTMASSAPNSSENSTASTSTASTTDSSHLPASAFSRVPTTSAETAPALERPIPHLPTYFHPLLGPAFFQLYTPNLPNLWHTPGVARAPLPNLWHSPGVARAPLPNLWHSPGVARAPLPNLSHTPGVARAPLPNHWHSPGVARAPLPNLWHTPGVARAPQPPRTHRPPPSTNDPQVFKD